MTKTHAVINILSQESFLSLSLYFFFWFPTSIVCVLMIMMICQMRVFMSDRIQLLSTQPTFDNDWLID